jgi:putative nucleotidyltransferase with HDIG domain
MHIGSGNVETAYGSGTYSAAGLLRKVMARKNSTPEGRVLVIDDDPTVVDVIRAALDSGGISSEIALNSQEALRRFADGPRPEMVLLDIVLRGGDGLHLLERLKQLRPETPVVMISGVHDIKVAITAMKKGAYDYLLKPVGPEELLKTVRRGLAERDLDRRDKRKNLERLVEARTEMLQRALADLERSYDITLEALGNALDLKDAETEGHSKRVTAYAIVIARGMGLDPRQVKVIAHGAYLHDIGKMAIPDAILAKPDKLTPEEEAVMREHCALGYMVLKKIPFLEQAAEIVFSHQEHFDGSGYSRGLKGAEIPIGARIFAVADALDAITSDRPYRRANSFAEARREIERCSGTQFDPAVVAVFREVPDKIWVDLRAEIDQPRSVATLALNESLRSR